MHTLSRGDILHHLLVLNDILASCINGSASVSSILPFSTRTAIASWQHTIDSVAAGGRIVLAALSAGEKPVGTVRFITHQPRSQPHRANVTKFLAHRNIHRQGVADTLMNGLEHVTRQEEKTVLVLDTAAGSGAEQLYVRCGWEKVREIPRYALMSDGEMTATSLFCRSSP